MLPAVVKVIVVILVIVVIIIVVVVVVVIVIVVVVVVIVITIVVIADPPPVTITIVDAIPIAAPGQSIVWRVMAMAILFLGGWVIITKVIVVILTMIVIGRHAT